MPEMTKYEPGMFSWIELATRDAAAAKTFYTSLFGWTVNEIPMGPNEPPYMMMQKNGKDVGGLYQNTNFPPSWLSYVAVENVDDKAKKAKGLGAKLLQEAFDVMDVGRMATFDDPQGAKLALWQARRHRGAGLRDEANTLCWNEMMADDLEAAQKFYGALFDWKLKVTPGYTEIHLGERGIGGLMQIDAEMKKMGMRPNWKPYFAVDDCDATFKKAQSLGVKNYFGPHDIEKVGRFAILEDPQGANFAIIQLTGQA